MDTTRHYYMKTIGFYHMTGHIHMVTPTHTRMITHLNMLKRMCGYASINGNIREHVGIHGHEWIRG